jgi:kynurenine formamidase
MRIWLLAAAIGATCAFGLGPSAAQTFQMPPDQERCPSRWGADDQRGSANWVTPETVLRATRLIKTGEIFELGAVLTSNPQESFINEGRQYNLYTKPSIPKPNTRSENEEIITTELGQIGTQVDAFAHQMWNDSFYNCLKQADIATRTGFKKLGVENFGTLMSRGVMIDVAGLKGMEMLPPGYVITPEDLQQALARQNLKLQPGDAVIINTGYGKLLGKDNVKYGKESPGIGIAAGRWLVTQDPMLIGADNCCVEVRPSEPGMSLPVHSLMLIQHGIILLENLLLEKLVAAGAQETAFIMQPLKLRGATGSAVAPIAIR